MSFLSRVLAATVIGSVALVAQSRAPEVSGDWPMYSHSLSGQRYSPLTEITAANVARLAPAWSLRLTQPAAGGPPPRRPAAGCVRRSDQAGARRATFAGVISVSGE